MLQPLLDAVSQHPHVWTTLRRVVEDDFRGEREAIRRELDPFRDIGKRRFLDFGCGTGLLSTCFPTAHYVGMDYARRYVGYAGQVQRGAYAVMDGTKLGLAEEAFDAALVLGVFHHMSDDVASRAVAELWRVLKPEATLLAIEDVAPEPASWNVPGRAMQWLDRGDHIRTDEDYRALFTGFAMQRAYGMRSGICDYRVYVLERLPVLETVGRRPQTAVA